MAGRIDITVEDHIAVMTIKRPEKLNAFDIEMLQELSAACDKVEADGSVRVAILTGEGKAFSAGGDIKAWGGMEPQEFGHAWVRYGHRVFERLATLRMPLIAAMNGHALGGGLELAAAADIRIVEKQAKIGSSARKSTASSRARRPTRTSRRSSPTRSSSSTAGNWSNRASRPCWPR